MPPLVLYTKMILNWHSFLNYNFAAETSDEEENVSYGTMDPWLFKGEWAIFISEKWKWVAFLWSSASLCRTMDDVLNVQQPVMKEFFFPFLTPSISSHLCSKATATLCTTSRGIFWFHFFSDSRFQRILPRALHTYGGLWFYLYMCFVQICVVFFQARKTVLTA